MTLPRRTRIRLGPQLSREEDGIARDTQQALDTIPDFEVLRFEEVYQEPLYVKIDHEPEGLLAIRVREVGSLETPIACFAPVMFTWDPQRGGARIDAIEGPTAGTKYRFTFLAVG